MNNTTYLYYNYIFAEYMKAKYSWYKHISKQELLKIMDTTNKITFFGTKLDILSYYNIYQHYLKNIGKTFIDLGCAPGGFLKFANQHNMIGVGITLNDTEGLRLINPCSYKIIYGNIITDISNIIKDINITITKVDFVNMGAISYTDKSLNQALLLNQFILAETFLKQNGSIMFICSVFDYIYTFIDILNFLIDGKIIIKCIPVQPNFKTAQIYIHISNITITRKTIDGLRKIFSIKYIPIVSKNIYLDKIKNVFNYKYFDILSFIETYYLFILRDVDIENKNNKIKNNKISIQKIKYIVLSINDIYNINLNYIKFGDVLSKYREQFIENHNLKTDNKNNIINFDKVYNDLNKTCDDIYIELYKNINSN
jgi:hypothetical protein